MNAATLLTQDDLRTLTGKQRPAAQRRALDRMGIRYHVRPDGRPVVPAAALVGGDSATLKQDQPDWSALSCH